MLDLIVLHGEFSLFTVRSNFWYKIYQNQRQKILCQLMALITQTIKENKKCGICFVGGHYTALPDPHSTAYNSFFSILISDLCHTKRLSLKTVLFLSLK